MSGSAIETWLSRKQRKALFSARLYFVTTSLGGIVALLPNLGIAFLICKILLLVTVPMLPHPDIDGPAADDAPDGVAFCGLHPGRTR